MEISKNFIEFSRCEIIKSTKDLDLLKNWAKRELQLMDVGARTPDFHPATLLNQENTEFRNVRCQLLYKNYK